MTQKTRNIIGWILTGLVAFAFIASGVMKLIGGEEVAKGAASMGLTPADMKLLGVVELISILLFVFPRTGLLGTLLMAAYLGGVIATHLQHGLPLLVPVVLQSVVWITAAIRFPELTARFLGKPIQVSGSN